MHPSLLKQGLFRVEAKVGAMLGHMVRPSKCIAQASFVLCVRAVHHAPRRLNVLLEPFFREFGRAALDRRGPMLVRRRFSFGPEAELDIAEKTQRLIFAHHMYERELVLFMEKHLQAENVVVDVGANVGYFSLLAASRGCAVLLFEPDPVNVAALERNISLNGYTGIQVFPCAVGAVDGTAILHVNLLNRGGNSLNERAEQYQTGEHRYSRADVERMYPGQRMEYEVSVKMLDSIVRENDIRSIAVLKVDVEGFERHVFEGMRGLLQDGVVQYIVSELGNKDTRAEVVALLGTYGYGPHGLGSHGELTDVPGRDVVFVRHHG